MASALAPILEKGKLTGYAAVFNVEAVIGGQFREVIAPGAFTRTLEQRDDVVAVFNHNADIVLGRLSAGTLRLWQDAKGLRYEIEPQATQQGRDLVAAVHRREVKQSSFSFTPIEEEFVPGSRGKLPLRIVREVRLWDVSPVTWPAYESTTVSVTSSDWRADNDIQRQRLRVAVAQQPTHPNVAGSRARLAAIAFTS